MGNEIDLLIDYPRTKRNVQERGLTKTEEDRAIARQFGQAFFDGNRRHGYGGYSYQSRFWQPVVPTFQRYYALHAGNRLLDIGCGKGFMLHDFIQLISGIKVNGVDISSYAIHNALDTVKPFVEVADARTLPFEDHLFDLVISINTLHNLELDQIAIALQEIERVGKGKSFITVDAYRNEEEKALMFAWNLTAQTILHVEEWTSFFKKVGYSGDYYWFIP